jgi:hypothetical protein
MHRHILLLACCAAALPGCGGGPRVGAVEGTVTVDGKPVSKVQVAFYPEGASGEQRHRSIAITDDEGKYRLRCDNKMSGAMVGTHKVVVVDLLASSGGPPAPPKGPKLPTFSEEGGDEGGDRGAAKELDKSQKPKGRPPRASRVATAYATAALTPLRFEVKDGSQTINLELKSK